MKIIEVLVAPNGETKALTTGIAGPACIAASKFLVDALGVSTAEQRTAEYFQAAAAEQHVREGGVS